LSSNSRFVGAVDSLRFPPFLFDAVASAKTKELEQRFMAAGSRTNELEQQVNRLRAAAGARGTGRG
jgi:hypothetical protein